QPCPGGAEESATPPPSIEHIPLVEFDLVSAEQLQQLRLEIFPLVMLLLPGDVVLDAFLLRLAYRENRIPLLPGKTAELRERVVDPFRGAGLDCAHQVGNGRVGPPAEVNVDVIFEAADVVEHAVL